LVTLAVQVMLINAVKDVASALGDLIQATKAASGKSINDPSMNHLKDSAKVCLIMTYLHGSNSYNRKLVDGFLWVRRSFLACVGCTLVNALLIQVELQISSKV
jgi:hypothetical protein